MAILGNPEIGGRRSVFDRPLSRRGANRAIVAAVAGVGGLAAGFGASEAVHAADNSTSSNSSEIRTGTIGERLSPVEGSTFRNVDSRYQERNVLLANAEEELKQALEMVRDSDTLEPLPGTYKVDFTKQFVVLAAFGPSSYVSYEDGKGTRMGEELTIEVSVQEGRVVVQPTDHKLLLDYGKDLNGNKPELHPGSPVFLAVYDRVLDKNGNIMPVSINKPKIQFFNSPAPYIS